MSIALDCLEGLGGDIEAQLRGESHRAHHTQRVVREGDISIARGANCALLQIAHSIEWVDQFTKSCRIQRPRHSVDCEIAAALVVVETTLLDTWLARIGGVGLFASTHKLHLETIDVEHCGAKSFENRNLTTHLAPKCLGELYSAAYHHNIYIV